MNNIKHQLTVIFTLFFVVFSFSAQARLTQSIDRTEIHAGESFLLTIQVDKDTGDEPDLSLIPKEFTIISNSQYQQMKYVNGQSSVIKGWKIKLSTLKTGPIIIPEITVGNEKTKAIAILIKDTSDRVELNGQKKAIFLESKIDRSTNKDITYVQQQIIFTIKLYRSVNTHYARLSEPTAGDSIVEKLGEDIQYDKTINNTRYIVTERRYAIFPQQSGPLTITAVNFTADVNDPKQRGVNRFLNTTRPISVNSKAISLNIQPQPETSSTPWMPATNVVLAEKWSSSIQTLTVGEPVTWTLLLYAQGLSESQLTEIILPKVDGLQFYPDTAQKERQVNDEGILGERIEKLAVIPSKEGEINIPEIQVKWWDVNSNSEKVASIAARTITVKAATISSNQTAPNAGEKIGPQTELPIVIDDSKIIYWQGSTFVFLVLWLISVFSSNKNKPYLSLDKQAKNKSSKKIKPLTETQLLKELLSSIKQQDNALIESSLLSWISSLSEERINSLGQLIHKIDDHAISEKLTLLQNLRYSNDLNDSVCTISKIDLEIIAQFFIPNHPKNSADEIPALYPIN